MIYDIDQDGFISNGELFQVLKTMVGSNLTDRQLQEIVDKTILYADKDGDGKISFDEFCEVSWLSCKGGPLLKEPLKTQKSGGTDSYYTHISLISTYLLLLYTPPPPP